VAEILFATEHVLGENGAVGSLQYSPTEGFAPLREAFAAESRERGIKCFADDFLITTGSQQTLDLAGRFF
jgi:2-aminoadipate transaminase